LHQACSELFSTMLTRIHFSYGRPPVGKTRASRSPLLMLLCCYCWYIWLLVAARSLLYKMGDAPSSVAARLRAPHHHLAANAHEAHHAAWGLGRCFLSFGYSTRVLERDCACGAAGNRTVRRITAPTRNRAIASTANTTPPCSSGPRVEDAAPSAQSATATLFGANRGYSLRNRGPSSSS
jgi:hypothetical protein